MSDPIDFKIGWTGADVKTTEEENMPSGQGAGIDEYNEGSRLDKIKHFFWRLTIAPFATALAFLGIVSGIRALVDPNIYPVHAAMHGLDYGWAVMFLVGGLLLMLGMGFGKRNWEAAGCALYAAGAFIEAVSYGFFLGWTRTSSWVTVLTLGVFSLMASIRFIKIWKLGQQVRLLQNGSNTEDSTVRWD